MPGTKIFIENDNVIKGNIHQITIQINKKILVC